MPEPYILEKWLWTEEDFKHMGWHDARIHAVAFATGAFELAFDIDYILRWVQPSEDKFYRFWIAPATLVFENVYDVKFDLEPFDGLEIADLRREDPQPPRNAQFIGRDTEWRWVIETQQGNIILRAIGYKQHFRREPVFGKTQSLDIIARGGYSFHRGRDDVHPTV